jgi:hypothetical protein
MIKLGDEARDTISGFKGQVIAITEWLYGCRRISIQPRELKDHKPVESYTFDEAQVELVAPLTPPATTRTNGGPRPEPTRNSI